MNFSRKTRITVATRLGVVALFLLLWWWGADHVPRGIVPTPEATANAALRMWNSGQLPQALGESLMIYASGLGFATVFGITLGILMGTFKPFGRAIDIFVYGLAVSLL